MPVRSAAAALPPTDSRNSPSAVRRISSHSDDEDRGDEDEPGRDEADVADAEALQQRAGEARVGAAVEQIDHQPDAAARHHQDQGRDDRLDVEHRDQKAVPQAAQQARAERDQQDDEMRIAGVDAPGDDGAADGDDRADREIDALGADHDRHAERDERGRHGAIENVDQIAEQPALDDADLKKPGRDDAVDGEDERQRHQRPDRPVAGDRAQSRTSVACPASISAECFMISRPAIVRMTFSRVMSRRRSRRSSAGRAAPRSGR